jgi:hypothetical protein
MPPKSKPAATIDMLNGLALLLRDLGRDPDLDHVMREISKRAQELEAENSRRFYTYNRLWHLCALARGSDSDP